MGIQKPFLEPFTTDELMRFIDHYAERCEILQVPDHPWEECDLLARFFGFGYDRTWSQEEIEILSEHYPQWGADETSKLLILRSPLDCSLKAQKLGLRTVTRRKRPRKEPSPWMIWEYEILEKYYPIIGAKVSILLPERTEEACAARAHTDGLDKLERLQWSKKELDILMEYYPQIGLDVKVILPGRTEKSIYRQAGLMKLNSPAQWTAEEDELLRLHYPQLGKAVAKFFAGRRSEIACGKRAVKLGVTYNYNRRPWSESELEILEHHYPQVGRRVSEMLPGRTAVSCEKMAMRRNLSYCPSKVNRPKTMKKWTPEEIDLLRTMYPKMGPETYRLFQNRTKVSCTKMASKLGLDFGNGRWSDEEDDILKKNFAKMGTSVSALLPGRTKSACQSRAKILKIYRDGRVWTSEEDAALVKSYLKEGPASFHCPPGRTKLACQSRLRTLGIHKPKAAK